MAHPDRPQPPKVPPSPKIDATRVPPAPEARNRNEHEERTIDEALDESFPASDPPAVQSRSSALADKRRVETGREVPKPDKLGK